MHMASPEACFQAATAEECLEQIHRWMHPETPFYSLLLRDAIEHLCLETMTPETHRRFAQLGPVNLFAMVSGWFTPRSVPFLLSLTLSLQQFITSFSNNKTPSPLTVSWFQSATG